MVDFAITALKIPKKSTWKLSYATSPIKFLIHNRFIDPTLVDFKNSSPRWLSLFFY